MSRISVKLFVGRVMRLLVVFGVALLGLFISSDVNATSSTLSLSFPSGNTASLNITGFDAIGSFGSSNDISISVNTNNSSGYTLSISSNTSNAPLNGPINTVSGATETLDSIGTVSGVTSAGISASDFSNSSNTQYNNKWGYKPSKINSLNNTNFLPAPSTTGDIIDSTTVANANNTPNTYTLSIGARVTSDTVIGSYSNTFVVTAVANATPYTIIYDDNAITYMPVDVNTTSQTDTVNISSNVPAKDGYTFLGWCDTTPTTTNGVDSCPSGHTVYNPNGNGTNLTYTLNGQSATNNLHLYAMWSKSGGGSGDFVGVTVNFAGTGVESVTFTNLSDGNKYTVAASGVVMFLLPNTTYNITMTPDYRFDSWSSTSGTLGSTSTMNTTYSTTSNDTLTITGRTAISMQDMTLSACQVNVGTNGNAENIGRPIPAYDKRVTSGNNNYPAGDDGVYSIRYINGACWMTMNLRIRGTISATDSNFSSGSINVSQYDLITNGASGGECYGTNGYNNPCLYIPDSADMSAIGITAKELGVWYNYYAASAGTIGTNNNKTIASNSICPSGWHLPTGPVNNTSSEFYKLFQSTSTGFINPNNYLTAFGAVRGGYRGGRYYFNKTSYGYWWSATASSAQARDYLYYDSSFNMFREESTLSRYYGLSIRCVKTS